MAILHSIIVGVPESEVFGKDPTLMKDVRETYTIDIYCKHPKVMQFLAIKMKEFMDHPSIDASITKILQEENKGLTPDWVHEEYPNRFAEGK